jgi:hypothetical protein
MAQLNFNAASVVPDTGVQDPIPPGWYNVAMVESEMKPTSSGDGYRLAITFAVIDGQFTGRKLFEGLNLKNPNAMAQEIAYKQLSAIAHAVGVMQVDDSSQLHNIPLKVKVKIKPASGSYDAGNSISAYKNINEVTTAPGAAAAPQAPASFAPPPVAAPGAAAGGTWTPPAGGQPWTPPGAAAPAAPAWVPPAAAGAAPAAPAAVAAPAGAAPAAPVLATPPWAVQA